MSSFIQTDPYSKVSTNRLLFETESLNSKVNQYRQALSLGFPSTRNDSINMSMYKTATPIFNPQCNINTLNSLSNTFTSMSRKPEIEPLPNSAPQTANNFYITNLKQSYEKHINDLYSNFKLCLSKLEELSSNYTGSQIDAPLIKKVINDNLFYERENQIAGFIEEISELKSQQNLALGQDIQKSYEDELSKVKKENMEQKESLLQCQEELTYVKSDNEETKNEMDRLQKIISVLEIDLNKREDKLTEKNKKYEELQVEYGNLQTQFFDASLKYKKCLDENVSLKATIERFEKERKDFVEKYSMLNSENSDNYYEKNYKEQLSGYEKQVSDYKEMSTKFENELKKEKDRNRENEKSLNSAMIEMQDKVKLLSNEWEKKLKNERNDYEKIISEIEFKHKNQLDTLYNEHQAEIESKNNEISKLKKSDELLKNFEKEYIRITEHEKKVNEIIDQYKEKFEKEFENKKSNYEVDLQMKLNKIENDKKLEYNFLTDNIKTNLQKSEKENFEMKNKIMQLENQNNLLENKIDSLSKENLKLSGDYKAKVLEVEHLNNEINLLNSKLRNEKDLNNSMIFENKSLKEKHDTADEIEKQLKNEKNSNIALKNEINQMQIANQELELKLKSVNETNLSYYNKLQTLLKTKQELQLTINTMRTQIQNIKKEAVSAVNQMKASCNQNFEIIQNKITSYENYKTIQLKEKEKQYEAKLKEQQVATSKIQQENKNISEISNSNTLKINDMSFKINELENEIKNYKNVVLKQKKDIELKQFENDTLVQNSTQSCKRLKTSIDEMFLKFSKIKKGYQSQIFSLKTQINNLKQVYLGDMLYIKTLNKDDILRGKLNLLENENRDNKELIQKLKIKLNGLILEKDNKNNDILELKNGYEKLIEIKDKKIKDLQCIVNQSMYSYSSSVNSIKVAKKLNNDVKVLIQKAKTPETILTTISDEN